MRVYVRPLYSAVGPSESTLAICAIMYWLTPFNMLLIVYVVGSKRCYLVRQRLRIWISALHANRYPCTTLDRTTHGSFGVLIRAKKSSQIRKIDMNPQKVQGFSRRGSQISTYRTNTWNPFSTCHARATTSEVCPRNPVK